MEDRIMERAPVRGFFRVHIVNPDGSLHGDSGWYENQIVNLGFNDYLAQLLGNMAGSKQVTHVALGTGTEPGAAGTSLQGELGQTSSRAGVTAASSNTSKRVRFTATFASQSSFVSTTMTLKNIGLFNTSEQNVGTLFCGNTYATSTCASNQNVNWRHLLAIVRSKLRKFGGHLSEIIPSQQQVSLACGRV